MTVEHAYVPRTGDLADDTRKLKELLKLGWTVESYDQPGKLVPSDRGGWHLRRRVRQ